MPACDRGGTVRRSGRRALGGVGEPLALARVRNQRIPAGRTGYGRVGHGIAFRLDHCGNCNGVWCDGGEWEIIRASNLHDNLHQIFGSGWQRKVRDEEQRARMEAIYRERFGAEDYEELRRIRRWIDEHPQRSALIAYLNNRDPYRR